MGMLFIRLADSIWSSSLADTMGNVVFELVARIPLGSVIAATTRTHL
jgi:hypothetical protein